MRKFFIAMMLFMPLFAAAQNTWEMPEANEKGVKANPDQKYLVGAVPVVDGRVTFHTVIDAPGKSADQIYSILHSYFKRMIKEPNQTEQSRLALEDSAKHCLCGSFQEWLVFKSTALVLDRTRFLYNLIAECSDGKADISLTRIVYIYDEERNPQTLKAEEWITDEYGLKKSKQKLSRLSGKFRRKTIDRKDYLFNKIASLLK